MLSPLGKQKHWEDVIASFEAIRKIGLKLGESRCIALVVVVSPCLQAPQHP